MDKVICWNVRGINHKDKQIAVRNLIANQNAGLVGLLETRIKTHNLGKMYVNMFNSWCFSSNNPWHAGGRIAIAWNPMLFHVNILFCSSQMMHLYVELINNKKKFYITFVYAFNKEEDRKTLWADLSRLNSKDPWVVLGDFNAILDPGDRVGERSHNAVSEGFLQVFQNCKLEDVRYGGCRYTWCNKQIGGAEFTQKLIELLLIKRG